MIDKLFIFLDFETYWHSRDYTLSKMGPIEYIRDPRFESQLLGVKVNNGPCKVLQGSSIQQFLESVDWSRRDIVVVGHNLHGFDAMVLSDIYGIRPYYMVDTLCLARKAGIARFQSCSHKALTDYIGNGVKTDGTVISDGKHWPYDFTAYEREQFIAYCRDDVEQCAANFYAMQDYLDETELEFQSLTARMVTEPMLLIDRNKMQAFITELDAETEATRNKVMEYFHFADRDEFLKAIRSPAQFCAMLKAFDAAVPMKLSEKKTATARTKLEAKAATGDAEAVQLLTDSENYTVYTPALSKQDLDFLAMLEDPDPRVACLVQARLDTNSSIHRSRAVRFLELSKDDRPLPIMLQCYKAHTGRYAAGNAEGKSDAVNFQNLSKRNPKHKAIRKAIHAPKGYVFVSCDSSQIEARILAYMANQHDLLRSFAHKEDPYSQLAERMCGIPWKEIRLGEKNGDPVCKMWRNVGKTGILSCVSGGTMVLTDTGWAPISLVSTEQRVWDGTQWVRHRGVICNGLRKTVPLGSIKLTPEHLLFDGFSWKRANEFVTTQLFWKSALQYGEEAYLTCVQNRERLTIASSIKSDVLNVEETLGLYLPACVDYLKDIVTYAKSVVHRIFDTLRFVTNIPELEKRKEHLQSLGANVESSPQLVVDAVRNAVSLFNAIAAANRIQPCLAIGYTGNQQDVTLVPKKRQEQHKTKITGGMQQYVRMLQCVDAYCLELLHVLTDAETQKIEIINIMEDEEYSVILLLVRNFLNTLWNYRDMIIQTLTLIESTTRETTNPVISALQHEAKTQRTGERSQIKRSIFKSLRIEYASLNRKIPVYDMRDAGDKHRFLVYAGEGFVLSHNCGFGVGAKKFSATLWRQGVHLSENHDKHEVLAKQAHDIYRATNANIVAFWKRAQQVIQHLEQGGHGLFGGPNDNLFEYDRMPIINPYSVYPSVKLPSGYMLRYPNLRMERNDKGRYEYLYDSWQGRVLMPTRIYGGYFTENLTQSTAFFLLIYQAVEMAKRSIQLIGNIHDAWVACVPESEADATKAVMMECMSLVPPYLAGLPVACEAEIGVDYTVA